MNNSANTSTNIVALSRAFAKWRKQYAPMLRAAKREMTTPMQKSLLDTLVAQAFSAGYNTPHEVPEPLKLKGWKAGVDRRL